MRPAPSFPFALLTFVVTLIAWSCLAVMMLIFLLWAPFAWGSLKLASFRSGRRTAADSSSVNHTHSLMKQTGV